jgi:alpha-1,3/alpha-1,6-mannosyltransferase
VFLSINRYERKKNLGLAIQALADMEENGMSQKKVHLVLAGGYDERVTENTEYFEELIQLAADLKVEDKVSFLKSPSDVQKHLLLHSCTAVVYTPEREHFGIVPLEAMYMRKPVIACNSGGPLETVRDQDTGFLCDPHPEAFAAAMVRFVKDKDLAREMGSSGHEHVRLHFSYEAFKNQLNNIINRLHLT